LFIRANATLSAFGSSPTGITGISALARPSAAAAFVLRLVEWVSDFHFFLSLSREPMKTTNFFDLSVYAYRRVSCR
jgi:hypothetical protein